MSAQPAATPTTVAKSEMFGSETFAFIPLKQLGESPTNPRKHWNKKKFEELVESVKAQGVVQPILVRATGLPDIKFEIVFGHRRYKASVESKLEHIPAIIRKLSDNQVLELQAIENLQREDINGLDEAESYQRLLDLRDPKTKKPIYDVAAIAGKVGKSVSYVYMRLKLTDLVPEAKEAFYAGHLTAGHAEKIARLQPEQQKQSLEICIDNDLSVRDLANWIETNVHLDLLRAPFDPADAELLPAAKACTTCPKRTGTQPELFADIGKKDTCTDPGCFQTKVKQHFEVTRQKLESEGHKVIEITTNYYSPNKKVATADDYTKAGSKKCNDIKMGLVVDGTGRGEALRVCTNKKCRVHHPELARVSSNTSSGSSTSSSSQENAAQKIRVRQNDEADQVATSKSIRAILQAFDKKPKLLLQELQVLCIEAIGSYGSLLDEVSEEAFAALCIHHGLKAGDHDRIDFEKIVEQCKKPEQVLRWLYSFLIGKLASDYSAQNTFNAIAKARGVDTKKLHAEILAQVKAKDKDLAAASKKAKTKPAATKKKTAKKKKK